MVTVTYDPAYEQAAAPVTWMLYEPARDESSAPQWIAPIIEPGASVEEAMPMFRKGGPVPELIVMCGCGFRYATGVPKHDGSYEYFLKELVPRYHGIAVTEGLLYGFAVNVMMLDTDSPVRAGLMWFRSPGDYADQIGAVESDPVTPSNTDWRLYTVQGFPPVDPAPGSFLVPYVRITDTLADIPMYLAGAQVYVMGETGTVSAYAPDLYITLGDVGELLGEDEEQGGGYLIGDPEEKQ